MKIHKTQPTDINSPQWKSDAPQIKGMRAVLPFVALLSAVSLAGGVASFFNIPFNSITGILSLLIMVYGAYNFDSLGVTSGQSVIREYMLAASGDLERGGWVFNLSIVFSCLICLSVVTASFFMSKDGVSYLVTEFRASKKVTLTRDTTLSNSIDGVSENNNSSLDRITITYQNKVDAVNRKFDGKISTYRSDIERKERQRTKDNSGSIDRSIIYYNKLIGKAEQERGQELATLADDFDREQLRLMAKSDTLNMLAIDQAKAENEELTKKKKQKEEDDKRLASLVSSIFSCSVIMMLFVGVRLTMLETRNGILPNPILIDSDLSGGTSVIRLIMTIPNFLHSCLLWASEKLYQIAPKHPTPTVDNDLINYAASQETVLAKRKERASIQKEEKKILKEVKAAEAGSPERKVNAFDLIGMYLQSNDQNAINDFYMKCVSFVSGLGVNPFHERRTIGFVTNGERNSSYNGIRSDERNPYEFSENSAVKVPEGHKVCDYCRTVYQPNVSRQKFCSNTCRSAYHRERGNHEKIYTERHKS